MKRFSRWIERTRSTDPKPGTLEAAIAALRAAAGRVQGAPGKDEAAAEATGCLDPQPDPSRTSAAADVPQVLLELTDRQCELTPQLLEGHRIAVQSIGNPLTKGQSTRSSGKVYRVSPKTRGLERVSRLIRLDRAGFSEHRVH